MAIFHLMGRAYDLLYRDKPYAEEVNWLVALLQKLSPDARNILELGCGSMGHGIHLARHGYTLTGIDRSAEMLELAKRRTNSLGIELIRSDIVELNMKRTFDAVLALFHVFSYLGGEDIDRQTLLIARRHLRRGGVLMFDYWHWPAVRHLGPEHRVKQLEDETLRVIKTCSPVVDPEAQVVVVANHVELEDRITGNRQADDEIHRMRCYTPDEVNDLLVQANFRPMYHRAWMGQTQPDQNTWSAFAAALAI